MANELLDKQNFKGFVVPEQVSFTEEIDNQISELNWIKGLQKQVDWINKYSRSFVLELKITRRQSY